jgi:hypothetical protein
MPRNRRWKSPKNALVPNRGGTRPHAG